MSGSENYTVVAIGQLPPPVSGFSVITEKMIDVISTYNQTIVVDISPKTLKRGLGYHFFRSRRVLSGIATLVHARMRKKCLLYIACEGDGGLLYNLVLVGTARLLAIPIFLHHHSFGYIDHASVLMRALIFIGGGHISHVFLGQEMHRRFSERYGGVRCKILSNAAFVPHAEGTVRAADYGALRLGLLSNLNREKGLYLFLELLTAARASGLNVFGILAGPVENVEDQAAVAEAVNGLGERLRYIGPVYGSEKTRFYKEIDVFVFPTLYKNEAQPTVLFEALSEGNLIVAHDRGCIAAQVGGDGLVIPKGANFVSEALKYLQYLLASGCDENRKNHIAARFRQNKEHAFDVARTLFDASS